MNMKRLPAYVACTLLATCGGADNFEVSERSTATVPGASLIEQLSGDLGFPGFANFDLSQNDTLENQGVTRDQIDSVKMKRVTLTVIDPPSGQDFTFMTSLRFFVEAPGMERALIASGGPFPEGAKSVELDLEDVELAPYAAASSMTVSTEVSGRRPSETTQIEAALVLDVDVNVGGVICGG